MYYERHCIDCKDCIKDPADPKCSTACADKKKNCYENYKTFAPKIYGKAYIVCQPSETLFDLDDAIPAGTIFKNMYDPYCNIKYTKGGKACE